MFIFPKLFVTLPNVFCFSEYCLHVSHYPQTYCPFVSLSLKSVRFPRGGCCCPVSRKLKKYFRILSFINFPPVIACNLVKYLCKMSAGYFRKITLFETIAILAMSATQKLTKI